MATAKEAEWLRVQGGSPLLLLRDLSTDREGRPVRRTKELLVGDRVRISYIAQPPRRP